MDIVVPSVGVAHLHGVVPSGPPSGMVFGGRRSAVCFHPLGFLRMSQVAAVRLRFAVGRGVVVPLTLGTGSPSCGGEGVDRPNLPCQGMTLVRLQRRQ